MPRRRAKGKYELLFEWLVAGSIIFVIVGLMLQYALSIRAIVPWEGIVKYVAPLFVGCMIFAWLFFKAEQRFGKTWWWKLLFTRRDNPNDTDYD